MTETPELPTCGVAGCKKSADGARGWCYMHYSRWYRTGDPNTPPRSVAACGTYAAYKRHIKRGEPVDDECRVAYADFQRSRRVQRSSSPYKRALWRLSQAYPRRFRELLAEEEAGDS